MVPLSRPISGLKYLKKFLRRPEFLQAMISTVVLAVGAQVYLLDRGVQADFVPDWLFSGDASRTIFIGIGDHLPSFAHTFAVTMMITAVLWPWRRLVLATCAAWFGIACLLEVGQTTWFADWFGSVLRGPVESNSSLDAARSYFQGGTYDHLDIVAVIAGSISAYLLSRIIIARELDDGE